MALIVYTSNDSSLILVAVSQFSSAVDLTSTLWKYFQLLKITSLPICASKCCTSELFSREGLIIQFRHQNSVMVPLQLSLSTSSLDPLADNLMSRTARKVLGLLNCWSVFDANQVSRISNGSFSKAVRFFAQLAFSGGLSGDIFSTNYQNKSFLLYFSLLLLSFGVLVSWEKSEFESFVLNWNDVKFQNPPQNGRPSFSQELYL